MTVVLMISLSLLALWLAHSRSEWRWRAMRAEADLQQWKEIARVEIATSKLARRDTKA